jgi:hypothetical protein
LGYFVGVKIVILDHIEIASIISILLHFHPWAILSVNHKKALAKASAFFNDAFLRNVMYASRVMSGAAK